MHGLYFANVPNKKQYHVNCLPAKAGRHSLHPQQRFPHIFPRRHLPVRVPIFQHLLLVSVHRRFHPFPKIPPPACICFNFPIIIPQSLQPPFQWRHHPVELIGIPGNRDCIPNRFRPCNPVRVRAGWLYPACCPIRFWNFSQSARSSIIFRGQYFPFASKCRMTRSAGIPVSPIRYFTKSLAYSHAFW